ncbi:MAG: molybdenum cofactor guanylyltransferase [Crocinitomicaceae bacterium]|nr:molybdenum cofactor guanylyltransferase [Crocinitomicaceae bacterium]
MKTTGVVLAGGESSRMGTDKGLVQIDGKTMVEHVLETLKQVTEEVVIISNNKDYEQFGVSVFQDEIKLRGPVGGIYTALKQAKHELVLVLSCDSPYVNAELLEYFLKQCDSNLINVVEFEGKVYPLIGLYRKSDEKEFLKAMKEDRLKLQLLNKMLGTKLIQIDSSKFDKKVFWNFNSPAELEKLK